MATSLTSVLIIYTGGTIGMAQNPVTGALEPFNFHHLLDNVPELRQLGSSISTIQFEPPIDSSEIEPSQWERLVYLISENYDLFDGFVVLHGTDTMAYTASAVSFMLENLSKPVIFTGSQLPVGVLRTDGKENLITAIEIASAKHPDGSPVVPEVCIFFENSLMRGNRTRKISAENFNAFASPNYPLLAQAGVHISYDESEIRHPDETLPLKAHYAMDNNIAVLKLYPGISRQAVHQILGIPGLKGVVMETFGAGNAPKSEWFLAELREAIQRGIVIVNVTQCNSGSVQMGLYSTGNTLQGCGVLSGYDSTTEAAIAKLMFLFGHGLSPEAVAEAMNRSFVGEITIPDA
ncbi:MAG TPA: type I asparaginase [Candidatus Barnesiella excrementipullorum]|uniref:asparaginase n=1 Tax=Candidatus Barnesiella excrementipullorum TaxID=2838479 RepID=A0A9D2APK7_9BACT|nr:type I asparaginase [Candidatus Barnesiella excrementipullorum]